MPTAALPRFGERINRIPPIMPTRSAVSASNVVPARDERPVPSAHTSTVLTLQRPITLKVNLPSGGINDSQPRSSLLRRTFQPPAPATPETLTEGRREAPGPHGIADWRWFPPAATSNRACGSPAHGSPTFFTAGIRLFPSPRPVRARRDDDSIEADQAQPVRRLYATTASRRPRALVAFGHEQREAVGA